MFKTRLYVKRWENGTYTIHVKDTNNFLHICGSIAEVIKSVDMLSSSMRYVEWRYY